MSRYSGHQNLYTAKFIGEDGSLDYKKGAYYVIRIEQALLGNKLLVDPVMPTDKRHKWPQPCPYSSLATLLKNWQIMEVLDHVDRD